MNRRVMEKSFVSPTKGTEEVRRDYYTDYGGYIPSGQKYNNSGHMRSFHSPSEEISNNNYKDKFQGHVRSFQVDNDQGSVLNSRNNQNNRVYSPHNNTNYGGNKQHPNYCDFQNTGLYQINSNALLNSHKAQLVDRPGFGSVKNNSKLVNGYNIYGTCSKVIASANNKYGSREGGN